MVASPASLVDPRMAQGQAQAQDVQQRTRQIQQLASGPGGGAPVDKDKKLRDACEGFESIFIQKMWEQMRATVPKTNFLHGREEQFWQGMFDQELAKKMASVGGIGLADMMYDQLSRTLVSASRTTASATQHGRGQEGFTASPAPLVPEASANAISAAALPTGAQALYTSEETMAPASPPSPASPAASQDAPVAQAQDEDEDEPSPVVQQFLAELRQRQAATAAPQTVTVSSTRISGTALAQRAQQTAGNRPPLQGVMPAMATPATPLAPQFILNESQKTPPAQTTGLSPDPAPLLSTEPSSDPSSEQTPPATQDAVSRTFTTNIPPRSRRSGQPRAPRVPSGQPLIRTLSTAPASPITADRTGSTPDSG